MGSIPAPQQAVQAIQGMILRGEFKIGDRLPSQRDLSQILGLSRASLREATSILETLGLVRAEPGRGVFVIDKANVQEVPKWRFGAQYSEEEVYQLRLCIEPEIAGLAALRADSGQLSRLRESVSSMGRAISNGNLADVSDSDRRFHKSMCEASGNRMLGEIYDNMSSFLEESQRRPMIKAHRLWETVAEHEAIVKALEKKNPQAAYRKMRQHIQNSASRISINLMTFFP
jgi:GntR family transcriptional repressor for pyruvate dehydrogenase complex